MQEPPLARVSDVFPAMASLWGVSSGKSLLRIKTLHERVQTQAAELAEWNRSLEQRVEQQVGELERLARPANMAQGVYVIHMPPYRLGLDECDPSLKVGSRALYDFLLEHQPRLSLHGHIHQSPRVSGKWQAKLGDTHCIQPGQFEPFTYVIIDLQTMKLECDRFLEAH